MQTSLHVDGANCPNCFNETLDALATVDGVLSVHGSLDGPCIEIEHEGADMDVVAATIRNRLHGIAMYSNEVRMVPLEFAELQVCVHHHPEAHAARAMGPSDHHDSNHHDSNHHDSNTHDSNQKDSNMHDSNMHDSNMHEIVPSMTLGEIITLHPALAVDLEKRGLDYCCHGARTLAAAATEAGLDPQTVADELSAARIDEPPAAWVSLGVAELVDHIQDVHHGYLWEALPRISALVDKIVSVHGDRHPELAEVQRLYNEVRADFEPHLLTEEQVVFPLIRRFAVDPSHADAPAIAEQIVVLAAEHETVGELLEDLNRVTGGYQTPADGCATYNACYLALAELEADTHLHIHKESNVLFPAVQVPAGLSTSSAQ